MIAYIKKNPLGIGKTGEMLLCDFSYLRYFDEPIPNDEIDRINEFLDARVLKRTAWWRRTLKRSEAVEILVAWIEAQATKTHIQEQSHAAGS